jgi:hypothetical protein
MSDYVIQVRKRDGEPPEILSFSGEIPAGAWAIHGGIIPVTDPAMPDWLYLSVSQRDPDGRYVEQVRHERPVS